MAHGQLGFGKDFWQKVYPFLRSPIGIRDGRKWLEICGGGFRTRATFTNHGDLWGSDPGCYLTQEEIAPVTK